MAGMFDNIRMRLATAPEVSEQSTQRASEKSKQMLEGNELINSTDARRQAAIDLDQKAEDAGALLTEASEKFAQAGSNEARYLALEGKLNRSKISDEEMAEMENLEENGLNQQELRQAKNQAAREKRRRDQEVILARGEKPKRDYEHEKKLRNESEEQQKEALKFAIEAVSLFPEDVNLVDNALLKMTEPLTRRFSFHEGQALASLKKIQNSMSERFPAEKDDYQAKYDAIEAGYATSKETIDKVLETEPVIDLKVQAQVVSEIIMSPDFLQRTNLNTEDIQQVLEGVGVVVESEENGAPIEIQPGSQAEQLVEQFALVEHLTGAYQNILEAVKENPQAVDRLHLLGTQIVIAKENLRGLKARLKADVIKARTKLEAKNLEAELRRRNEIAAAEKAKRDAEVRAEREQARRDNAIAFRRGAINGVQTVANGYVKGAEWVGKQVTRLLSLPGWLGQQTGAQLDRVQTGWEESTKANIEDRKTGAIEGAEAKLSQAQVELQKIQDAIKQGGVDSETLLKKLAEVSNNLGSE